MKKKLATGSILIIIFIVVIEILPIGRNHNNPPVIAEPAWDSPRTRELAVQACFDCHSNESTWPWYSNIAPVSWLVQQHVVEGRSVLNFSEWNNSGVGGTGEITEVVSEGNMPPASYMLMHPQARLSASELNELAQGLQATFNK